MRQGTSRVVPVVVSAGLAVGVFCGLLFGLGTGEGDAATPVKVSNGAKRPEEVVPEPMPSSPKPAVKVAPAAGSNAGSAVAAGSGSAGAGSATGSAGTGSAAEPAVKPTKLVVEITPESAIRSAKVFIDDKEITGTTAEIAMEPGMTKKKVKVTVKTAGFKDVEQEIEAEGESTTLKLELVKGRSTSATAATGGTGGTTGAGTGAAGTTSGTKSTSSGAGTTGTGSRPSGTRPSGSKGKGKGKGSGGLIDI